jgi:hypothetical protein
MNKSLGLFLVFLSVIPVRTALASAAIRLSHASVLSASTQSASFQNYPSGSFRMANSISDKELMVERHSKEGMASGALAVSGRTLLHSVGRDYGILVEAVVEKK